MKEAHAPTFFDYIAQRLEDVIEDTMASERVRVAITNNGEATAR